MQGCTTCQSSVVCVALAQADQPGQLSFNQFPESHKNKFAKLDHLIWKHTKQDITFANDIYSKKNYCSRLSHINAILIW